MRPIVVLSPVMPHQAAGTRTEPPVSVPTSHGTMRAATATPDPAAVWHEYFPASDDEMASQGLAYYRGGDPSKPVVYEDFLPVSAAGIFRSNLDADTQAAEAVDDSDYGLDWMAGQIGHHIHDPYELYEKAELR